MQATGEWPGGMTQKLTWSWRQSVAWLSDEAFGPHRIQTHVSALRPQVTETAHVHCQCLVTPGEQMLNELMPSVEPHRSPQFMTW